MRAYMLNPPSRSWPVANVLSYNEMAVLSDVGVSNVNDLFMRRLN